MRNIMREVPNDTVTAEAIRQGDVVRMDDVEHLVVRVAQTATESMLELWQRGAFEHTRVFLPRNRRLSLASKH
jgi:hypothetical protein